MAKYVMALDAGTTSNRCILFNEKGEICSVAQKEFTQIYPQPGWVEHNANEIWDTQLLVCRQAMEKIGAKAEDIAAIGITNQRETTIIWDKKTGEPVYNAIVWQCRRTAPMKEELLAVYPELEKEAYEKTGLVFDPYFSCTKARWILNNVPGVRERAEAGNLAFGTVDSWLIFKLTKGRVHATDYSNASRTQLFNINTCQWDPSLCKKFDIPMSMLPEAKPSSGLFGETDPVWMKFDPARKRQIWPVGNHVTWKFPGVKASGGKPFTMEWCDGIPEENPPACVLPTPDAVAAAQKMRMKTVPAIGKMIRGSKGWMMLSHGSMPVVLLHDGTRLKAPKIARGPGHYLDFLNHCLDGSRGALDFVLRGTAMQDALLLGNAAQVVPGVELVWDAKRRVIANSAEATQTLYPKYRDGWTLEGLA